MLQHFRGNLDNWDPALIDELATEREVILFDYPGVGSSTRRVRRTIAEMARDDRVPRRARASSEIDLLGFSIGGFVAQEIALLRPPLVRRLVLAATGPHGGAGMHGWSEDIAPPHAAQTTPENLLHIFFALTETSRARAEFLGRFIERRRRSATRRTASPSATRNTTRSSSGASPTTARCTASTGITEPDAGRPRRQRPHDPDQARHLLAGLIPNAQIRIYPDAAHGFLFQYPTEVAAQVSTFLRNE